VRVLTWNLFHGRSVPGAGRSLLNEFSARLDGWAWDVALLQEVPPWWPPLLARACGADQRLVLTSRNWLLPIRQAISSRNPDLLKSNGGGCNAILVRGGGIHEHRTERLTRRPEPRFMHGVRLAGGIWVVNLHASTRGAAGEPKVQAEARYAAGTALGWAGGAQLAVGGDFNLRGKPELPGLRYAAGHYLDHVYVSRIEAAGGTEVLDRGALSDHAPVAVDLGVLAVP
jgi:endonuclease/exonuclease/phosphatase family metal-dependent hydrolase